MAALNELLDHAAVPDSVCIDISETETGYALVFDLPGASAETTDLWIDDGHLHVEAQCEKPTPDGFRLLRDERSMYTDVSVPLPGDWAFAEEPTATVENGVLVVELSIADPGVRIPVTEP